jgi:hypothetical protein
MIFVWKKHKDSIVTLKNFNFPLIIYIFTRGRSGTILLKNFRKIKLR